MASPVLPSDFAAGVPAPTDSTCEAWRKIIANQTRISTVFAWMFNADGTLSDDFLAELGSASTALAAPSNLSATDDDDTKITLTWSSVAGAVNYSIYRGTTSDTSAMTLVHSGNTTTTYEDEGASDDVVYWYAVRAHGLSAISDFSSATTGRMPVEADPTVLVGDTNNPYAVRVPSGKTRMEVRLWGGGGNGGYPVGWGVLGQARPTGGGGAGGSFYRVTNITVDDSETYYVVVGQKSAAYPAGETVVYRDSAGSSEYVKATAGGDGSNANTGNGTAGAAAGSAGTNLLGTGTVEAESSVGSAGSGTSGGAGVTYNSLTKGAGASGAGGGVFGDGQSFTAPNYGSAGYAVIVFT